MAQGQSVFVHIVSFHSAPFLESCLNSVLSQEGYVSGQNLFVRVTDNASRDGAEEVVRRGFSGKVDFHLNETNLGFCGGHNQGAHAFLASKAHFLLVLNPDTKLTSTALLTLTASLSADARAGTAGARLVRCDEALNPLDVPVLDSAGMFMTPSLRHFDRGSGELDSGQYSRREYVFGATGACLLLKRECVVDLLLDSSGNDAALHAIYPQLRDFQSERAPLFDEAFFAYREDADLAWRAEHYGWKCLYEPAATVLHKRVVVPERRSSLPPELNRLSVRNRFLLQLNNYTISLGLPCFVAGFFLRNLLVILGVLLKERTSLTALSDVWQLRSRAYARRKIIMAKAAERRWSAGSIRRWFKRQPYVEST